MTDDSQEFARLLKEARRALKDPAPSGPRPRQWLAALLGAIQPGLGQLYTGDWLRAICWWTGRWVLFGLLVAIIWLAATPSDRVNALWTALAAFVFYQVGSGLVTRRLATEARWSPRPSFTRPLVLASAAVLAVAVDAAGLAITMRHLPLQQYRINGSSMQPTLRDGDRLFGARIPSTFVARRGTLVLYRPPESASIAAGRVIALPGDAVAMRDGRALVNGFRERTRAIRVSAPEPSRESDGEPPAPDSEAQVPPDHVFILGDNRADSRDSRTFGAVPIANIVGRPAWWLVRHDDAGEIDWSAVGESVGP